MPEDVISSETGEAQESVLMDENGLDQDEY